MWRTAERKGGREVLSMMRMLIKVSSLEKNSVQWPLIQKDPHLREWTLDLITDNRIWLTGAGTYHERLDFPMKTKIN